MTAGHDLATLDLPVRLEVADGTEKYITLPGQEQLLKAGDMFMADRAGIISSILYGPDQRTRITPDTKNVLFTVYGTKGLEESLIRQHLEIMRDYVLIIAPQAEVKLLEVYH